MVQYFARDVLRILDSYGFKEVSIKGDHHKFKNPFGRVTIVPYTSLKDNIRIGTYKKILKDAGIIK